MPGQISFKVSKGEAALIGRIVDRARRAVEGMSNPVDFNGMEFSMDLTTCHANGCRLDLQALLNASDFEFAHDVWGIRRHLDRTTGKLRQCFNPRFAQRQGVSGEAG